MAERFAVSYISIDISAKLVLHIFQLTFHVRFTGTEHQEITIAMMLVNGRTDTVRQQVSGLFTDQSSYKCEQWFFNVQAELPTDLFFIFKLPTLHFLCIIIFCNEIIRVW